MALALPYDGLSQAIEYIKTWLSHDLIRGSVCLTLVKIGVAIVQKAFCFVWDVCFTAIWSSQFSKCQRGL